MGLRFEWHKWVKLPKNQLILVALVAVFINLLVSIDGDSQKRAEAYLTHLKDDSGQFVMNQADTLTGFIAPAPDLPATERKMLSNLYLLAYSQLDSYYLAIENHDEETWQGEYLGFLATLKELEGYGMPMPSLIESSLALAEAKMTYLKVRGLVSEESLEHPTGIRTMVEFLLVITSLGGMSCLLLLFYDWFTFEYEHQQIRLLHTQPFKRSRVSRNKTLIVLSVSLGLGVGGSLLALLYGRLRSGHWGSLQSPIAIYEVGNQIELVTLGQLLLHLVVFLVLSICVTLMVLIVMSYLTRKSVATLIMSLLILGLPVVISQTISGSQWLKLTPFYSLSFNYNYASLIKERQLFSQTCLSGGIFLVVLLLFVILSRYYLNRLNQEEVRN